MGKLILQFILREIKIQASFIVKGKEEEQELDVNLGQPDS